MNYGKADLLLNENVLNTTLNLSVSDYSFNSTRRSIDEENSLPNINCLDLLNTLYILK